MKAAMSNRVRRILSNPHKKTEVGTAFVSAGNTGITGSNSITIGRTKYRVVQSERKFKIK